MPRAYNADADITADVRSDVVKEKKKVSAVAFRTWRLPGTAAHHEMLCLAWHRLSKSSSDLGGMNAGWLSGSKWCLWLHVQKKKREEDAAAAVEEVDAQAEADAEAPPKKKKVRTQRTLCCCCRCVCEAVVTDLMSS